MENGQVGQIEKTKSERIFESLMLENHGERCQDDINEIIYSCDFCLKSFNNPASLQSHKRFNHQRIGSHKCTECGKCFNQNSDLKRHYRTHTGERPFACEFCELSFTQPQHLKAHHLCKHAELPQKPFACEQCDKSFLLLQWLKRHQKCVHQKNRPFECKEGDRRFSGSILSIVRPHIPE